SSIFSLLYTIVLNTVDYVVDTDRGVIAVQAALYGRQDRETCSYGWIMDHPSDTNCSSLLMFVRPGCDGRTSTSVFGDPCVGIYKHLEVKCTAAAVCF
uniref:SUEL-type lectin domain-containing protein n=1 Tax=Periophthalmus magnuspinnatus TaxID=409849 RepID=A0A3B4BET6_9GOBI